MVTDIPKAKIEFDLDKICVKTTYNMKIKEKYLQQEWAFVQRVTPGVGAAFGPVKEALQEVFFPALFQGLTKGLLTRANTRLPVKQARLAIPYPVQTDPENWTASFVITGHLVAALRGQAAFRTANHTACLQGGQRVVRHKG